ncbi:MAG: CBS domain-containing protein [Anaerolineaceae bacterium]|jgi:CBS domain-containing protein/anti-sigma regulatory factor (Ser/Thr protein kinase)|nr:MAG: signal transduction protein [Chloroflexi bacterium HGW-Chloroflexi-8]
MDTSTPPKTRIVTDQEAEDISRVEELAYELKINEVMTATPITLAPELRMREVLEIFRKKRISGAPVITGDGNLVGILSMEDLIRCLIDTDLDASISKYMTTKLITVANTDPIIEALKKFVGTNFGRLLVVDKNQKLAGIITKGDINRGILKALEHDYQTEEIKKYRASHLFEDIESDRTSLILRYKIKQGDFNRGGQASSNIKRALIRLGASKQIARRCGIAIYEAEMNLIIHTTEGGVLRVEIESNQITIDAYDYGPGIKDVQLALKPGYSTASEAIREMGFGAGMGLANISRCVDQMKIESVLGKGTRLKMRLFLENDHPNNALTIDSEE